MNFLKVTIFFIFFLTGCATIGAKQSACEQKYSSFEKIVNCTKKSVSSDLQTNNAMVKLYFLKGDQLVEKVKKGEMSELDARTEWQTLYVQLQAMEDSNKIKQTNCYATGNDLNCTT